MNTVTVQRIAPKLTVTKTDALLTVVRVEPSIVIQAPGPQGATGPLGSTILTGTGAPAGGTGATGDLYIDTASGNYYSKATGSWVLQGNLTGPAGPTGATGPTGPIGPTGPAGSNGTNGTNGATWRQGSAVPNNGTGVDGDFYLRTTTGDVYQRASGTYSVIANITGPQGATGSTGPQGPTGPAGSNGSNGSNGTNGATWYVANGVPSNGTGVNGDWDLRSDTGQIYSKAAGAWSVSVSLTIPAASISDSTAAGRAMITAADSAAQTALLNAFVASGSSHKAGMVPDPGVSAGTTKFLREDASWQVPPSTASGGSSGQVQFNSSGAFGGAAGLLIDANGFAYVGEYTTTDPSTPASGVVLFTRNRGARRNLAWLDADGAKREAQRHFAVGNIGYAKACANSSTLTVLGMQINATGTATARAPASGSYLAEAIRTGYVSAASAGSNGGMRGTAQGWWRGNAAGHGGFRWVTRFGIGQTQTGWRWIVDMIAGTSAHASAEPSALVNVVGVGMDSTDTTIKLMFNDASGTCTKVDTGLAAPTTSDVYEFRLSCLPNSSSFQLSIEKIGGSVFEYDTGASTNIPANTSFLCPHWWINNNATAAAVALDFISSSIETDV